jgi:uncharacterized membrane protein YcaP (DUF421 family)
MKQMGKDYSSVSEGIVLVLTIVGWQYVLDWAAWRYPPLRSWLNAPSLKLIEDGRLIEQNMRKELLTREELASQLRQHGVESFSEVRAARLEGDGRLSVFKMSG